ncbi:E3 ubiquitin- ligase RNF8 isoform X2 [Pelobates cultripes]|uniref:E3 ubiquitin-protein ligase CHFR n=1 Tax=Pelobates cultripes TaxID=61616 RepID=A0AAD1RIH4_PELCU|nr:E3 ubiquitin- ligase RNF8 isoform X2 [Pelobates cultripes]
MAAAGPTETWSLRRRGGNRERLTLPEGEEVTIGRGLGVNYQLTSTVCPLMISRVHCILKQNEDGLWTITDNRSLNGVWLNKTKLEPRKAYVLSEGTCVQLGVPLPNTNNVEFEYDVVKESLEETCSDLEIPGKSKGPRVKRKFNPEESEDPGTEGSSNPFKVKIYRVSRGVGESEISPCKMDMARQCTVKVEAMEQPDIEDLSPTQQQCRSTLQLSKVRQTMEEIRRLNVQMQVKQQEMQEKMNAPGHSKRADSKDLLLVQKELHDLQNQLSNERVEHLHRVQELKQIFAEQQQKQGERKQAEEEQLKEQLAQALQEHTLLMEELKSNKNNFEQIIQAKNKELEETKQEKEKVRAQKEEVLNHMNDVLDNELQCIICSEHFIEAVTLNCAHSFCSYCITQWRKRKDECPICRQDICSQTRSLVLDNCIDRMVDKLSPEMKDRRTSLIIERKALNPMKEVIPILTDSDSNSLDPFSSSDELDDEFEGDFDDIPSESDDEDDDFLFL